jgi:hypothetical protein
MNDTLRSIEELASLNINKSPYDPQEDVLILEDLLNVNTPDEELFDKAEEWKNSWKNYEGDLIKRQTENYNYWKYGTTDTFLESDSIDNLIFKSVETILPHITKENPEPLVSTPQDDNKLNDLIAKALYSWAKINHLNLIERRVVRNWILGYVGIAKVNWGYNKNDIEIDVISPTDIILSPKAKIGVDGFWKSPFIGEKKENTAQTLVNKFPKKSKEIKELVDGKMGTIVHYCEWWTDDVLFWTCDSFVLDKIKNPHWNEDTTQTVVDEFGVETEETVFGKNIFNSPKPPYIPFTVFNLGETPVDPTGLIDQAKHLQDSINQKKLQINRNAKAANNGWIFDDGSMTQSEAVQAWDALTEGGAVCVNNANGNAITKVSAPSLPNFIYESLIDDRNELEGIFGVQGLNPRGTAQEKTVRGKIISQSQDADRVSMITDYLEQFCANVYQYVLQMMLVYYDEPQQIANFQEKSIMISSDMIPAKVSISVKEGSLIPRDPLTERNEAIDLW